MTGFPLIIQGGMGAGVSNWRLARAVSSAGQLGVVSGVALDVIFARRLQDGDPGGHMRSALDAFPVPTIAERIWATYYIAGGKSPATPYKLLKMHSKSTAREICELTMVANFAEVWLARQGHENPVGINYLEKVQLPVLPSIYGAMLGGVDYVLMGAGIPIKIPGVLDCFAKHETASYPLHVVGAEGDDVELRLTPREYVERELAPLKRPRFLAIIASNVLAQTMVKRANGKVDGFIIEGPTAGGHNAPPRGKLQVDADGEAIYGERDRVDLAKMREMGLPFWLAGGYGSAAKFQEAVAAGAAGIQVGTAFAFCEESGLNEDYKRSLLKAAVAGEVTVKTDLLASPTNFPFKSARLEGTVSEEGDYLARERVCDLGYLRETYRTEDGTIGYRCAAEPAATYMAKGGDEADTVGRKCLCNGLMANIGLAQIRGEYLEQGLVTAGNDLSAIPEFLPEGVTTYTAADVLATLLAEVPEPATEAAMIAAD
jgi:nitronate monooxygenase